MSLGFTGHRFQSGEIPHFGGSIHAAQTATLAGHVDLGSKQGFGCAERPA